MAFKQVSIRFTEEEYNYLSELAINQGTSITNFIKTNLLRAIDSKSNDQHDLTLNDVDAAAEKLSSSQQFKIKQLFNLDVWQNFSKRSRLSVGRTFYTNVSKGKLKSKYKFSRKDSDNSAIYVRL